MFCSDLTDEGECNSRTKHYWENAETTSQRSEPIDENWELPFLSRSPFKWKNEVSLLNFDGIENYMGETSTPKVTSQHSDGNYGSVFEVLPSTSN